MNWLKFKQTQCNAKSRVFACKYSSLAQGMSRRSRSPPEVHFRIRNCGEAVDRVCPPSDAEVLSSLFAGCRMISIDIRQDFSIHLHMVFGQA